MDVSPAKSGTASQQAEDESVWLLDCRITVTWRYAAIGKLKEYWLFAKHETGGIFVAWHV